MFSSFSWLEAATALFDLSSRASCPFHCSSSCIPWFLAGLSLGFVLAVVLAILGLFYVLPFVHRGVPSPVVPVRPELVVRRSPEVERKARLAGYVE